MLLSSQNEVTKTSVSVTENSATTATTPTIRGPMRERNTPVQPKDAWRADAAVIPGRRNRRRRPRPPRAQQGVERGRGVDHAVGFLDHQRVDRLAAGQGL